MLYEMQNTRPTDLRVIGILWSESGMDSMIFDIT